MWFYEAENQHKRQSLSVHCSADPILISRWTTIEAAFPSTYVNNHKFIMNAYYLPLTVRLDVAKQWQFITGTISRLRLSLDWRVTSCFTTAHFLLLHVYETKQANWVVNGRKFECERERKHSVRREMQRWETGDKMSDKRCQFSDPTWSG